MQPTTLCPEPVSLLEVIVAGVLVRWISLAVPALAVWAYVRWRSD